MFRDRGVKYPPVTTHFGRGHDVADTFVVASSAATFGIFDTRALARLEAAGCTVRVNPYGRPLTGDEIVDYAHDCDAIVLGNDHLDAATIDRLPNLKLIARHGAGFDGIDFADMVRTCSRYRGYQCGADYAEGFRPCQVYLKGTTKRLLP